MTPQRGRRRAPVLEPLASVHRSCTRRPTWRCCSAPTRSPRSEHAGQLRQSGDPYITHPLAVATILAELGMDTTTLVAALLHDTVEDTGYTLERADRRLRRRGGAPGRRRHQAGQGRARQRRRGRDHPQDGHRDGPRPAGAGDQGRRPAAQHAHDALPAAGEAGAQGPRDAGGALRRWRTGSGWPPSSGSWRTCRSRSCTPRSTTRSCGWWPTGRRRATPTWPRCIAEIVATLDASKITRSSRAGPSTTGRSTRR